MIWVVVVGAFLVLGFAAVLLWMALGACAEYEREAERAKALSRSTQARYEVEQLSLGFHRAVSNALERYRHDHNR